MDPDAQDDVELGEDPLSTIEMLISEEIVSAPADITIRDAARLMRDSDVGLLVIGDRENVIGVVSERDVVRAVATGADLDAGTVADGLSTNLKWATPASPVNEVIEEMMEGYLRHILVGGDNGALIGIVSMRDLLAAFPA